MNNICEAYWRTIFLTILRYFSVLMIISGGAFIIIGHLISPWFYFGLFSWPLFIMLGFVNLKYIHLLDRQTREDLKKSMNH